MFVNIITQNSPPRLIKKSFFKHSAKFEFSKGINPWFWCRIQKFSLGCLLGKNFLTIKFLNILKKRRISRQRKLSKHNCKTWIFPTGLANDFWQKVENFSFFSFRHNKPWNIVSALWKNVNFSTFWTSWFYSLEKRFFVLEYRKRHFPGLCYLKQKKLKKWPFLDQNNGLTSLEKSQFFAFLNFLFL